MHHLPRFKTYTNHTLSQHPKKESFTDPTSITLLLGYIECRVGDNILIIICYPSPCGNVRAAGNSSMLHTFTCREPPSLNPLCNPQKAHTQLTQECIPFLKIE